MDNSPKVGIALRWTGNVKAREELEEIAEGVITLGSLLEFKNEDIIPQEVYVRKGKGDFEYVLTYQRNSATADAGKSLYEQVVLGREEVRRIVHPNRSSR